ncbi:hypothetical protein MAPG_08353 [Magnaporthiopsis poae ATCC 64411]|uniref:Uncharacterized protein n=1 Tax=Magnaporthiopsis poae (strain ATCC 64411 / 73-15) TaxID=644358 RepID=A0A0C4E751_MAGP6|nr:hypothetical protein MAPG_08353 [Magnaporthiopsis poae ATCC 64411]
MKEPAKVGMCRAPLSMHPSPSSPSGRADLLPYGHAVRFGCFPWLASPGRTLAGDQQNSTSAVVLGSRPRCVVSLTALVTVPAGGRQQPSTLA